MDFFFRIIGFLSIPLILVSVGLMIKNLRHEQRLTSRSLVIQLAMSPIILLIYALLLGVSVSVDLAIPLLFVGLALGALWGKTTKLSLNRGQVFGRRSIWYLVIWALTFTVTQGLALAASSGAVSHGLTTMFFSTGIAIGMNVNLLYRRWSLVSHGAPAGVRCPACGNLNTAGLKFCVQCGTALASSPVITSISRKVAKPKKQRNPRR